MKLPGTKAKAKSIDPQSFSGLALRDSLARLHKELLDRGVEGAEAETSIKELAIKCGCDDASPIYPAYIEPYQPLGGAQSFDDMDAWQEGIEWSSKYAALSWQLRGIMDNILGDDDLTPGNKGAAIQQAAQDFEARAAAFRAREAAETQDDEDEEQDDLDVDMFSGMQERRTKAGKRMAKGMLGKLQDAAETVKQVLSWGQYMENDPVENEERKDELQLASGVPNADGSKAKDPNVGGGVDRSKLPKSDFVFPEDAPDGGFPIVKAGDVSDAVSSWGRYKGPRSFDDFKKRLTAIANRKGFALPKTWKDTSSSEKAVSSFQAFKDLDGNWRFFTVYSNRYYDRENEVFPEAAHKEYVDYVERTKDYPELWTWHQPIAMGKADLIEYSDGLAMAAGYFYPGMEQAAERLSQEKDLGVSHGYNYASSWKQDDGSYRFYRTFEISPLPRAKAANEITVFLPELQEEGDMKFTKEKRDFLVKIHGEERTKQLEGGLDKLAQAAKDANLNYKEIADIFTEETEEGASAASAGSATVPAAGQAAADAAQEQAKQLREMIQGAVKEVVDPIAQRLEALEGSAKDLFLPRSFNAMASQRPSMDESNIVSGPRGGANSGAKGLGMEEVVKEANKQMGLKEDGLDHVPEHLRYYAAVGAMGAMRQEEEQPA